MFKQDKIAIVVAEFLGTSILCMALYFSLARTGFPLFTGAAVGLTFALMVMIFGAVSGGHFNPAITVAHWTRRNVSTTNAIVNIAAQFLGAVVAWSLIRYFMGHNLASLAGPKFSGTAYTAEALGAAIFAFGIAAAVFMKVEGAKFATAVGLSLFVGVQVAALASNGIINPAIALGVQSWNWVYATAPIVGAVIGYNLYALVFVENWGGLTFKRPARIKSKSSRTTTKSKAKTTKTKKRK